MLEEEQDAALGAGLGRLLDALDQPCPAGRVRRLERIVVALDPRPDDEVRAELAGERGRLARELSCRSPRVGVRGDEPAAAEARIEVEAARDAVDPVTVEHVAHSVDVLRRQLLRIVELVVVDQVAQPVDRATHSVDRRFAPVVRLIAARDEARHHRPEGPDSKRCLHAAPLPLIARIFSGRTLGILSHVSNPFSSPSTSASCVHAKPARPLSEPTRRAYSSAGSSELPTVR